MAVALGIAVVLTGIFEPGPGDPVLTTTIRSVDNAAGDGQRIASTLLPSAGYVVSPDGRFLTDRAGDIEWFILPLRCGGDQLEVRNVSVLRGSLRFTGRASDQAVRVELRGRLLDREHVRGIVAAHDPSCSPRRVRFSARVS